MKEHSFRVVSIARGYVQAVAFHGVFIRGGHVRLGYFMRCSCKEVSGFQRGAPSWVSHYSLGRGTWGGMGGPVGLVRTWGSWWAGRGKGGLISTFACILAAVAGVYWMGLKFKIFLILPYFLRSLSVKSFVNSRGNIYQVCYTRFHVSFYLWLIGSVLKHCKVPKYYGQYCRFWIRL